MSARQRLFPVVVLGSALILSAAVPSGAAPVASSWVGGVSNWSNPFNWSPALVPHNGVNDYFVTIDQGGAAVTCDMSPMVNLVTVGSTSELDLWGASLISLAGVINHGVVRANYNAADSTSTLAAVLFNKAIGQVHVDPSCTLQSWGTVSNDGQITVNAGAGAGQNADFHAPGNVGFAGTGSLTLNRTGASQAALWCDLGSTITNAAGHTIKGSGYISTYTLVNHGEIRANHAGMTLDMPSGATITNDGECIADTDCTMSFWAGTIGNAGGTMRADGTILLDNVTLTGGRLEGSGYFRAVAWHDPTVVHVEDVEIDTPTRVKVEESTMTAAGTWTDDGEVMVIPSGAHDAYFRATANLELNGSGRVGMYGVGGTGYVQTDPGVTITNGAGHSITGYGRLEAAVVNNGYVNSGVSGQTLTLAVNDKTNNYRFTIFGGSKMIIDGITINQGPGASIWAQGTVHLQDAKVVGGSLTGDGTFEVGNAGLPGAPYGHIEDLLIASEARLIGRSHRNVWASGTITNHGQIEIEADDELAELYATTNLVLTGSGRVIMRTVGSMYAQIDGAPGIIITNDVGHVIKGSGYIRTDMTNLGEVHASVSGDTLHLAGSPKAGIDGLWRASNNSTLDAAVDIYGTGTWLADGGTIHVGASVLPSAGGVADVVLWDGRLELDGPVMNVGYVWIDATSSISVGASTLSVDGDFLCEQTDETSWSWNSSAELSMTGGVPGAPVGLEVCGVDLGAVPAGWVSNFVVPELRFAGGGAATLLADAADNQPAEVEAIYVETLVIGDLHAIDLNGLNLYYRNGGAPKQLFYGDSDLDGDVDLDDLFNVRNNFGAPGGWSEGDSDGDGVVDLDDLFALRNNFGASSAGPVPEPASLALVLFGAAALAFRRRT